MVFKPRDRNELLTDAIAVLSEQGFHGTSFNDFAKAAGTNTNTLRRHFGTVEKLTETAYETVFEKTAGLSKLFDETSGEMSVRARAQKTLRLWYAELKRPWARLLFQAHVSGIRRYSASYQTHERLIERITDMFPKPTRVSGAARASASGIVNALLHLKLFAGPDVSSKEESSLVDSVIESWAQQLPD